MRSVRPLALLLLGLVLGACDGGNDATPGSIPDVAAPGDGTGAGGAPDGSGAPDASWDGARGGGKDAAGTPDADAACEGSECSCEGVVCDAPPPCHAGPGTCAEGVCSYAPTDGDACDDGDPCTTGDSCAGGVCTGALLPCDEPPAPACADDSTLVVSDSAGTCTDGACVHGTSEVACPLGCADGGCAGDPCAGVTCDTPPGDCFAADGTCSGGACVYAPLDGAACDDGDPCTTGDTCGGGQCAGSALACDDPPAAECQGNTLHAYASPGFCEEGVCQYATTDVPCPGACAGGACLADPCAGVACDAPPPCHGAGSCQGGQCVYPPKAGACDDGDPCTTGDSCQDGACVGSPKPCKVPPAPKCTGADTLQTWSSSGVCVDGTCIYAEASVTCPGGCSGGACAGDPCAGVTCSSPPSACYAPTGWCDGGACNYAPLDGAACDDGNACTTGDACQDGACKGKPKACNTPPAPACKDANTQVVYAATGTCGQSGCTYSETTKSCPFGCVAGVCALDSCAGVNCTSPANGCFEATGTCSGGACSYPYADGAACTDGDACTSADACDSGACAGIETACDDPPAPACDGDTLVTWAQVGVCGTDGACTYAEVPVACGFGCTGGACEGDPCAGKTCTSPPAATCVSPTVLRTFAKSGVCADGVCSYAHTDTPCPGGCSAGACAAPDGIVISEILYDSDGADTDTFVELHGPAGTNLGGFTLYGVNGSGGGVYQTIQLTGSIGADGLYVVAHPSATAWIKDAADQLETKVDYQNGPDSVVLAFGGAVVDAVAYGSFSASEVPAGEGSPAVDPPAGSSLMRDGAYTDADDNAKDFTAQPAPTPGAPNAPTCADGELFCEGACVDPDTSSDYCGATDCTKAPCAPGSSCNDGTCEAGCTDQCTAGAKKCSGALVQSCEPSPTGCLAWSTAAACPGGGSCSGAGACGMVISKDTELCGEHVVDGPFTVQGGAKVTCASGDLTVRAATIFIDPSSSIDLSGTSDLESGVQYTACTGPCNSNGINTGASGGGNATKGGDGHATKLEIQYKDPGVSCGGWWDKSCKTSNGPGGGSVQGSDTALEVTPGGMGGTGCVSVSPGILGTCYQGNFRPGGKGGGVIRLFAETELKVLGAVRADGADGISTIQDDAGPGGGAGGGILLYAPAITISGTVSAEGGVGGPASPFGVGDCGTNDASGGAGGKGRVHILYGATLALTGQVVGAIDATTFAPPIAATSATHPDAALHYNDTFDTYELSWEAPFEGALGYWYLVSKQATAAVTPANGTFVEEPGVTLPAATFTSAGTWYVHVVSVAASAEVGTVAASFPFKINALPPVVTSSSHPSQSAWYAQTTLTFSWAPPAGVDPASFGGFWYRLDHVKDLAPGKAGAGYTFTQNAQVLLTKDAAGKTVAPGTYYLHVVAEDTTGRLTKAAASYQVQVGPEPATTNFYGYVTAPGGAALEGVVVALEPYGLTATTDANGYFLFSDVYEGSYALTATLAGHAPVKAQVEVSPATVPYAIEVP